MKYFDVDLQVEFDIPFFENVSQEDLQVNYRDEVFRAMAKAIIWLGDNTKYGVVPCFSANGVIFEINVDGISEHITNCIEYFEKSEEYELCGKLTSLLERLK